MGRVEVTMANQRTIVFSIGSLTRGGAERVIVNLAEHFYAHGYKTYLVTKFIAEDEYPISEGIERIVADITEAELTDSRIRNFLARIRKLRAAWNACNPNLIVSFIGKNNFMTIVSAIGLGIPVVVSVRSAPKREYQGKMKWFLAKTLFPMANGVVLLTNQAKEEFSARIQKKAAIMPNPLHPNFMTEELPTVRKEEIVVVGRLDTNKNQILLLEAFVQLASKYPEWACHLYGEGSSRTMLETYVKQQGVEQQVYFHGRSEDVANAIRMSSIYALTSKVEGMPNALMEAMALGLACIATDCPSGGTADLIRHGENGLLVPVDDVTEFRSKLEQLIQDEVLREALGRQGWSDMKSYYPGEVLGKWQDYLEGFIK